MRRILGILLVLVLFLVGCKGETRDCLHYTQQYQILYYRTYCIGYEETKYGEECEGYSSTPVWGFESVCSEWSSPTPTTHNTLHVKGITDGR